MIPLTFLYDEYIDRPKFTEQKKNPFEYIVHSPTSGVGTISLIVAVELLNSFRLDYVLCLMIIKTWPLSQTLKGQLILLTLRFQDQTPILQPNAKLHRNVIRNRTGLVNLNMQEN